MKYRFSQWLERQKKAVLYTLSGLLPVLVLLLAFFLNDIYPFGDRQVVIIDFLHQYLPFINEFNHRLRGGGSLLWSWAAGGGHDYILHIAYYMASPFNMLAALFPAHMLREVLTFFVLVKIGLGGLFMAMYLKYIAKVQDMLLPVFSTLFALCGFVLGHYHNIMWIDIVAIAPLVMLGLHKLVAEKKVNLYMLSLAAAVILNFHIAFMVCIFVGLYFFVLCASQKLKLCDFFNRFGIVALATVAALGMTAFLALPTFSALQGIYRQDFAVFPSTIEWINSFFEVLGNFIAFNPPPVFRFLGGGSPNLFSGMLSLMLLPVFVISKHFVLREKIAYLSLLIFMVISTNLNALQFIWHGFTNTVGFPARFSFLISFVLVIIAYKTWMKLMEHGLRVLDLAAMAAGAGVFILAAHASYHEEHFVVWNILLAGAYLMLFGIFCKIKKESYTGMFRTVKLLIAVVVLTELVFTSYFAISAWNGFRGEIRYYAQVHEVLAYREEEQDFFRTEFNRRGEWNDPLAYARADINGISMFSSSINGATGVFMNRLGLPVSMRANRYHFIETSPLTHAFLGIRYLVERADNPAGDAYFFSRVSQSDNVVLLRNNYALPLGFMVRPEVAGWVGNSDDPLPTQNELFRAATGFNEDLFAISQLEGRVYGETSRFEFVMPHESDLYIFSTIAQYAHIYTNDTPVRTINARYRHIAHAGSFGEGQTVTIVYNTEDIVGRVVTVGVIDRELFAAGHALLAAEALEITEFRDTRITGRVTALTDGLLYTSIPHAGNWRAYVNGDRQDVVLVGGAMVSVPLEAGNHEIELRYVNTSFLLGSAISMASFGGFVLFVALKRLGRKKVADI